MHLPPWVSEVEANSIRQRLEGWTDQLLEVRGAGRAHFSLRLPAGGGQSTLFTTFACLCLSLGHRVNARHEKVVHPPCLPGALWTPLACPLVCHRSARPSCSTKTNCKGTLPALQVGAELYALVACPVDDKTPNLPCLHCRWEPTCLPW